MLLLFAFLFPSLAVVKAQDQCSSVEFLEQWEPCCDLKDSTYDCSSPGLESLQPGQYEGITVNYLSFATSVSSPNFPVRAKEFEACTGGKIVFSEAENVWEDPVQDLGTKTSRGSEVFDAYFMSYSHFPEVSALGLAEHLNERIRKDNARYKWEDVLPKVRSMGEYRKDGVTNLDFLMYDGDFFVSLVRIDLLEKHGLALPNTWDEVVEYAKFFNGTDLNDDGVADDFGFCHFPREGAGYWDWWFPEAMYSTWATMDQTKGIGEGFFFDEDTMKPRTDDGFRRAVEIWKDLWNYGGDGCNTNFIEGRCAIGFAPPGCFKGIFLSPDGVSRKDESGKVVWRPTMMSGEYAEPYRFKPFGSTEVYDRATGQLTTCDYELCPKAEIIVPRGPFDSEDRASVLKPSPLTGKLINRAPFYWSGGLGTLIRKSSDDVKKDMVWDFFVYTNSPDTSVFDVANYASWLDSWRYSQLTPGENFLEAGWSQQSYQEHTSVMQWALSTDVNGAFNLRIPGLVKYTRDSVGEGMRDFINGSINLDGLVQRISAEWNRHTDREGKLGQLEIYRAALGLDAHSEVELCRLHRELMDQKDPSACRKYDPIEVSSNAVTLLASVSAGFTVLLVWLGLFALNERRRRERLLAKSNMDDSERDEVAEVQKRVQKDNILIMVARVTMLTVISCCCLVLPFWFRRIQEDTSSGGDHDPSEYAAAETNNSYLFAMIILLVAAFLSFLAYDWLVRRRNRKLILDAAKSNEIMAEMYPEAIRERVLNKTKTAVRAQAGNKSHPFSANGDEALADLYPNTTVCCLRLVGFTSWCSTRQPNQVFQLLEAVFQKFGVIAKKNKVYKVETTGDCFVCITGAPNEQTDHPQRMCKFAAKCMKQFASLSKRLVMQLGPDTCDLQLRAGIHSGQVTMGVLRGERARYQLFGDTVLEAARMASTGRGGTIQLSKDTALALEKCGLGSLRLERSDSNGETYWLDVDEAANCESLDITTWSKESAAEETEHSELVQLQVNSAAKRRLIEWNAKQLSILLKRIIAFRMKKGIQEMPTNNLKNFKTLAKSSAFILEDTHTYFDEVAEIISFPSCEFVDVYSIDISDIELDFKVESEIRKLVTSIASLYNDNPFHNFEHASHVTLSILKLLSRIVKPSRLDKSYDNACSNDHSYGITNDPLTHFAVAFCGLIHDADHPGIPNSRLATENPSLANRFVGKSIAEQSSLMQCFELITKDDYENLRHALFASNEDQERFRQLVVNTVMATDIVDKELKAARNARWERAFKSNYVSEESNLEILADTNRKATIVIEHLIQASDVSHTMQHWEIYTKWNEKLLQEMYLAYKQGRSESDPRIGWAKGEIGFFDFYVIPLAKKLKECGVFGVSSDEYLNYALTNRRKWELEGASITEAMVARLEDMKQHHSVASRPLIKPNQLDKEASDLSSSSWVNPKSSFV